MNKLVVFNDKRIRRTWHDDNWYYVIEDVVFAITESKNPKDYLNKIKKRDLGLSEGWGQIVHTLEVETKGGNIAKNARLELEAETKTKTKVISKDNYLKNQSKRKLK